MREDAALVRGWDLIPSELEQAFLMINDEQDHIVLVKSVVGKCECY